MHWEVKRTGCSEKPGSAKVVGQLRCRVWSSEGGGAVDRDGTGQLRICGYWENFAWVCEWDGLEMSIGTEDHAKVLDGGLGKMTGLGKHEAQLGWATRAWPTWCEWHRRGFGWQWGKAGDGGHGDAPVAWWNKPSHHSLGSKIWEG